MYEYLKGNITEITPAYVIIECGCIGYEALISLNTYELIKDKKQILLYIYHYIREDDQQFFGFATKDERELFKLIISVNGIGVASARMMLSSLSDEEIRKAIIDEDVNKIKSIKGIGQKSAQRIIMELKDKIVNSNAVGSKLRLNISTNNAAVNEASMALAMLGFNKSAIAKVVPEIVKTNPSLSVEELIKIALKQL